jgi:hypothetical protein
VHGGDANKPVPLALEAAGAPSRSVSSQPSSFSGSAAEEASITLGQDLDSLCAHETPCNHSGSALTALIRVVVLIVAFVGPLLLRAHELPGVTGD